MPISEDEARRISEMVRWFILDIHRIAGEQPTAAHRAIFLDCAKRDQRILDKFRAEHRLADEDED